MRTATATQAQLAALSTAISDAEDMDYEYYNQRRFEKAAQYRRQAATLQRLYNKLK